MFKFHAVLLRYFFDAASLDKPVLGSIIIFSSFYSSSLCYMCHNFNNFKYLSYKTVTLLAPFVIQPFLAGSVCVHEREHVCSTMSEIIGEEVEPDGLGALFSIQLFTLRI